MAQWLRGSQVILCKYRASSQKVLTALPQDGGSPPGAILPPGHFGCHNKWGGGCCWHLAGRDKDPDTLSQGNNGHFGQDGADSIRPLPGARLLSSQALTCLSAAELMTARGVAAACPTCWTQEPHWGAEKAPEAQKRKPKTFGPKPRFLFPFGENHALRPGAALCACGMLCSAPALPHWVPAAPPY